MFYGVPRCLKLISIHAPAGGATYAMWRYAYWVYNFNSRPCGRGDERIRHEAAGELVFQFTPLREGRRAIM